MNAPDRHSAVRTFYDEIYYARIASDRHLPLHLKRLAKRLNPAPATHVLDVGCGTGLWLQTLRSYGVRLVGIDLSTKAIAECEKCLPDGEFVCAPAETLPFEDCRFSLITCLGSLEHFLDPLAALREMYRVATPDARILLLVPNAGFLTARLGLYKGTEQADIKEDALALEQWQALFTKAGFEIEARWKDLHVLTIKWLLAGPILRWPVRLIQALALPLWPLEWQYQIYHLCRIKGGARFCDRKFNA